MSSFGFCCFYFHCVLLVQSCEAPFESGCWQLWLSSTFHVWGGYVALAWQPVTCTYKCSTLVCMVVLQGQTIARFTKSAVRMVYLPKQTTFWHIPQSREHKTISTKPVIYIVPTHQKGSNAILRVLQTFKDNSNGSLWSTTLLFSLKWTLSPTRGLNSRP